MDQMKFETPDMTAENIDRIAELFPNCITEMQDGDGKLKRGINFEVLKQMLSPDVVDGDECYEFTWVGKKASIVEANKPIRKTLRPCPEESKNWDTTENLYIEGDNLEVLKLLQESYLGKVKMIYIDPPYNTGNDFIYADDFMRSQKEENEQMGMYDEDENRLFKNTDTNGRFHSDWCSMIYSRLLLARNLLSNDGFIFISIGEEEIENIYSICNEVFGKSHHVGTFIWKRRQMVDSRSKNGVSEDHEYMLCYSRSELQRIRGSETDMSKYSNPDNDPRGDWMSADMTGLATASQRPNLHYEITNPKTGVTYSCPPLGWRYDKKHMEQLIENGEIIWPSAPEGRPRRKKFAKDLQSEYTGFSTILNTVFNTQATRELKALFDGEDYFDFPKPTDLLKLMIEQGAPDDGIILDFFSGSATTAHAVIAQNLKDIYNGKHGKRKFIMIQLPEPYLENSEAYKAGYKNICEIGKERIRRAGEKELMDIKATAGSSMRWEQERFDEFGNKEMTPDDVDIGFRVFKLDDSNMKDVYYTPDEIDQDMIAATESNIKEDRTDLDLLFGCLLDWGLPLSMPYYSETIDGCTVHTYDPDSGAYPNLIACFNENIPDTVIKEIARRKPVRAVFRDSSFATSPEKINVGEIFKLLAPDTRVKVI